ncbi:MAG: hypothetical protein PHO83_09750 [Geobacteraceae bacterium]|nr:hypothetical protein [Geobacteraceae bacterium]
MTRYVFPLLLFPLLFGCSQTVTTTRVADTIELEVHDDGTMAYLNSGTLHRDWEEQAEKLCPRGYAVVRQCYHKEEPFKPARIVGAVQCR